MGCRKRRNPTLLLQNGLPFLLQFLIILISLILQLLRSSWVFDKSRDQKEFYNSTIRETNHT